MSKITVEFFHDVICSFCFPMSYRMRELQKIMPEVDIIHRSFALAKEETDFNRMFGSRSAAKNEILSHWEYANQNDDLHRFNIAGMQQTNFPFPTSMKALIACKAAFFVGGNSLYWDVFDALQNALFVENLNIESQDVINNIIGEIDIHFDQWKKYYDDIKTKEAVEKDLLLADQYNIHSVPCLMINGKYKVSGAQPLPQIIHGILSFAEEEKTNQPSGASCRFDDEKIICD